MAFDFVPSAILVEINKIFDETMGDENFASLQKDECVTEVNKKFLEVILENKTDDITKAYNQIFKPKKGIPVMNVESKNCSIFPFIFLSFALGYNDLRAKPVFCSLY